MRMQIGKGPSLICAIAEPAKKAPPSASITPVPKRRTRRLIFAPPVTAACRFECPFAENSRRYAFTWHCQVEALQRRLGATGLGLMPLWSRCAIALLLLIGRCEASSGRRDGAGG